MPVPTDDSDGGTMIALCVSGIDIEIDGTAVVVAATTATGGTAATVGDAATPVAAAAAGAVGVESK